MIPLSLESVTYNEFFLKPNCFFFFFYYFSNFICPRFQIQQILNSAVKITTSTCSTVYMQILCTSECIFLFLIISFQVLDKHDVNAWSESDVVNSSQKVHLLLSQLYLLTVSFTYTHVCYIFSTCLQNNAFCFSVCGCNKLHRIVSGSSIRVKFYFMKSDCMYTFK